MKEYGASTQPISYVEFKFIGMKLIVQKEVVTHSKSIDFFFLPWFLDNDGFEIGGTQLMPMVGSENMVILKNF